MFTGVMCIYRFIMSCTLQIGTFTAFLKGLALSNYYSKLLEEIYRGTTETGLYIMRKL